MSIYWMTEVLPLAVTAMLPVVLFPLTDVMTCQNVAQQFINDTNFLFIGGLIVAAAVEKCDLHERVALSVLRMDYARFMIVTALLSMFISNTATTAMMVPIGQSVVGQLLTSYESNPRNGVQTLRKCKRLSTALVLCICIAANIGGTGTITGTPSNLVMVGQLPE
ncbi:hypothetical protein DICVIV_13336 [Dictyocaulus viviparus]|uniref:Citrate transporter-like domain-containing protein n=1 Tax=Dictyocaulus viviparus TaxID=29172 RepID=A0A0D8XE68_DICVI|nr:hypothetical protein DICVIV_13336 [Dictyocaulus viviparus]